MKLFQTTRDALLKPLQAVTGIVEKRHTLPILSNVLIHGKDGGISLVATDLEIQASTTCELNKTPETEISITVSARKLVDILRSLPEESDTVFELLNQRLQVRAGRSRFQLQTLPAADFPALADPGVQLAALRLKQRELKELLLLVQYSMAQQDIRYYLNGLLLKLEGDQVKAVATDGHRLSYAARTVVAQQGGVEVILPRKAIHELVRLLEESDEEVETSIFGSQVSFRFGAIELITKVIDGKFPDYTRVIPTSYQKHVVVDRLMLLQALQRASILANEKFRGVRWLITNNALRISCTNSEQEEAQEELEVDYQGDPLDIGFNIAYLLDVLNNVQTQKVKCAFGDASSSMLVTVPEHPEFRYVVMPMRI